MEEDFKIATDYTLGLKKNSRLYYKEIEKDTFLVFTHFCRGKPVKLQGFDPYLLKVDWDRKSEPFGKATVLNDPGDGTLPPD